ncbi:two-component system, NarL family, sensor histidine kinase DegS [Anaerobranca californiensis DSM 14826]|uniref:histidine kinase n=1 Tax=Anaerobranca californiensis DSM 14826 TaxID=1120989 RepID=A0A1M6Q3E2_9FIRM|nr:sensor histidine kinase [Anaerobranca californiensis]SHK14626.1 two-component system, NarL family, sensor histidine kinase DegS [Anaerobranca californiensis DSM 14826]
MGNFDVKLLDNVTEKIIESIEKGKEAIFDISESARLEMNKVKGNLAEIQVETKRIVELVDQTEIKEKKARIRLMEVSKNFNIYDQRAIQEAYEYAHQLKLDLILYRQKERDLLEKRNELQIRLRSLEKMVEKAEHLINHVSVALDYLLVNIKNMSQQAAEYKQQKNIGYKIIQAQETERKRLAREIHDGPAQSLADIILNTEIAEKMLSFDPQKAKEEILQIKGKIKDTLGEIRRIIHQLRPMVLDDLGLIPTLKRYCEDFSEKNNIRVEFILLGKEQRFDGEIEVTIFRIVQEALQNIFKHSKASLAMVKVEIKHGNIKIIIKDNGVGFELREDLTDPSFECYGIIGIKERVSLLNGKFDIKTGLGQGTMIIVEIPYIKEEGK